MKDLSTKYMGLILQTPLIAGSCGLTGDIEAIKEFENQGIGAVVLKSIFEEEIVREMEANLKKMASMQFIYPETLDIFESEVVKDKITDQYLSLIEQTKKAVSVPVLASINCITSNQWTYFPRQIESAGADGLELNIFVLPSDMNKSSEENEEIYFNIIKEVKRQVSLPIAVKISYFSSSLASFIFKLSQTGIDGIVLFNRFYNPDFDIETLKLTSSNVLSSPEDISISLRWIALMSDSVQCSMSASTGVHDESGLIKQILAGADAVQIVSTLYKNGPQQIKKMLTGMGKWMTDKNYNSIQDFRGLMSKNKSDNSGALERVQFMKYVRGFKPQISFSDDQ